MTIYINKNQAKDIKWDQDKNKLLIRACFYLGYNLNFIEGVVNNPIAKGEADDIVQTALALGLNDDYMVSET